MTRHGTILLIEDNANDVLLLKTAFAEAGVQQTVHVVQSSEEAVKYLSGRGQFADRMSFPLPSLVLLDLKMPEEDGYVVLRWLYERPGLKKQFTIVALSTPGPDAEIQVAYELGAQSYLVKPLEYKQLVNTARCIKEYWLTLNQLPESGN